MSKKLLNRFIQFVAQFGKMKRHSSGVTLGVENLELLRGAENEIHDQSFADWVIVSKPTSDKGFRETDVQRAVVFLGENGIPATYQSNPLIDGLTFYHIKVPPELAEEATELLRKYP